MVLAVSVKKENRNKLSTSNKLKLAKAAREGDSDKYTFFKANKTVIKNFQTVYDLNMQI